MMARLLTFAGLATSLALPVFAQQGGMNDPHMRQQAEAIVTQYSEALNKGDTATLGSLYTPNAIDINPFGKLEDASTQFQIADKVHKMGLVETANVEDVEPLFGGQGMLVTASYTSHFNNSPNIPPGRGYLLFVLERLGESWKIRAATSSRLAPATSPK